MEEITFKDGKRHGPLKQWGSGLCNGRQGTLMVEKNYQNGKLDGFEFKYTNKEKIHQVTECKDGKPLYTQSFDEQTNRTLQFFDMMKMERSEVRVLVGKVELGRQVVIFSSIKRRKRVNGSMVNVMDYGLTGTEMDKGKNKVIGRRAKNTEFGRNGMRTDRKKTFNLQKRQKGKYAPFVLELINA